MLEKSRFYWAAVAGELPPKGARRRYGDGTITEHGYLEIFVDGRREYAHRHVMAQHIGRALLPDETVHHINGDKLDNRPANLELWTRRQPRGQRAIDLLAYGRELVARYEALEEAGLI